MAIASISSWTEGTTHADPAGTDRLLIVTPADESGTPGNVVTAITYGGQSLTEVVNALGGPSGIRVTTAIWYLDEAGIAAATSDTIALTEPVEGGSTVWSQFYENVDQVTVTRDNGEGFVVAGTPVITGSFNHEADDLGIAIMCQGNPNDNTWLNSWVEQFDDLITSAQMSAAEKVYSSTSTDTASAEEDGGGDFNRACICAATFIAAVAAGGNAGVLAMQGYR